MKEPGLYTVITGASRGLGKALAGECARRGRNLVLVSLPGESLSSCAKEISEQYAVRTHALEADLTLPGEIEKLAAGINERFEVNCLINNAGTGGIGLFWEAPTERIDRMILLNTRAPVVLLYLLLPNLKRNSPAHVLNISSMAAFSPMPYKTVYPASKAFLYSFSRGLGAELRKMNIWITVAHPGTFVTSPELVERVSHHGFLFRITIMEPGEIAGICIRKMLKKKSLVIPGRMNRLSWLFLKITPVWLRMRLLGRGISRELKDRKHS